jgi:hypothetical protein
LSLRAGMDVVESNGVSCWALTSNRSGLEDSSVEPLEMDCLKRPFTLEVQFSLFARKFRSVFRVPLCTCMNSTPIIIFVFIMVITSVYILHIQINSSIKISVLKILKN